MVTFLSQETPHGECAAVEEARAQGRGVSRGGVVLGDGDGGTAAPQLCRAIEIAHRPCDDEMEALAFVASEAHTRLETVEEMLRGLFETLKTDR